MISWLWKVQIIRYFLGINIQTKINNNNLTLFGIFSVMFSHFSVETL